MIPGGPDPAATLLKRLLNEPKDSATIHYDEDTIPHGACSDPVRCDCCCPACWRAKADIIRAVTQAGALCVMCQRKLRPAHAK